MNIGHFKNPDRLWVGVMDRKTEPAIPDSIPAAWVAHRHFITGGRRLVVMVPPWNNTEPHFGHYARRCRDNMLAFNLRQDNLTSDVAKTSRMHHEAAEIIVHKTHEMLRRSRSRVLRVITASKGGVETTLAFGKGLFDAKGLEDFSYKVITAGDSLAGTVLSGLRTQAVARSIHAQGITDEELHEAWWDLQPGRYGHHLLGKSVEVLLSEADLFIPYEHGVALCDAYQQSGANVSVVTNQHLGHVLTIGREYYLGGH